MAVSRNYARLGTLTAILLAAAWSPVISAHPELDAQIERVSERIAEQPTNADLRIIRGDLYRRHQDYVAADMEFRAARELDPEHVVLLFYRGRLSLEAGDPASAEPSFEKYLSTYGEHSAAWRLRGEANMALDQPEAAAEYFGKAISTADAPSPSLYHQQVGALMAAETDYSAQALEVVDAGLARFGKEITLLGLGVDTALASGNEERARAYLQQLPEGLDKLPAWEARFQKANLNKREVASHQN